MLVSVSVTKFPTSDTDPMEIDEDDEDDAKAETMDDVAERTPRGPRRRPNDDEEDDEHEKKDDEDDDDDQQPVPPPPPPPPDDDDEIWDEILSDRPNLNDDPQYRYTVCHFLFHRTKFFFWVFSEKKFWNLGLLVRMRHSILQTLRVTSTFLAAQQERNSRNSQWRLLDNVDMCRTKLLNQCKPVSMPWQIQKHTKILSEFPKNGTNSSSRTIFQLFHLVCFTPLDNCQQPLVILSSQSPFTKQTPQTLNHNMNKCNQHHFSFTLPPKHWNQTSPKSTIYHQEKPCLCLLSSIWWGFLWTPKAREQIDLYCCDPESHFIKSNRFHKHCQLKFCSYFQLHNGTFVHQFDWLHNPGSPNEFVRVLAILKLYPDHWTKTDKDEIDDWCVDEFDDELHTHIRFLVEIWERMNKMSFDMSKQISKNLVCFKMFHQINIYLDCLVCRVRHWKITSPNRCPMAISKNYNGF